MTIKYYRKELLAKCRIYMCTFRQPLLKGNTRQEGKSVLREGDALLKGRKNQYRAITAGKKILLTCLALAIVLYIGLSNYLLFHTLIEIFTITIGFSIFIISKNTHKVSQNNYFIFLGISFLIVSVFELTHTLSLNGLNIIKGSTYNISVQISLIARYMEAFTFLMFCILLKRENKPIKIKYIANAYYICSILLFASVCYWRLFPVCYIDGAGFTDFKKASEFVICLILTQSMGIIIKNKKKPYEEISSFLIFALSAMVLSEICFILYENYNDRFSIAGHVFKLLSYYLIYKAIIENTLEKPYNMLFYKLTDINHNLESRTSELLKINRKLNEEIAERELFEEKLKVSKKNYQELLDFLPFAVFTHCDGKIVFINNAALKLFNFKEYKDMLGKDVLDLVHPDYHETALKRMKQVYNNESTELKEYKFLNSEGKVINVETKAGSYTFKDKPAGISVLMDIRERKIVEEKEKALKEALEYDRIKNEFMANISHELRTPLNVIFGAVQLIEYYSENKIIWENSTNITKYSKSMRQNCYRMLRLVNNLIDLTKLDSGFLQLNLHNYNIVSVVEDITLSVAQYIESKNISIEFDTEIEEKFMACDTDIIERVILNLLSNAVKFTPAGGSIFVNIYDNTDYITVSVKDSGIGIAEDKLKLIFDRFRQVDKSMTRSTEGSGIGLSLVKSLVELHGGEIEVKSTYGEGSEFLIKLPFREIEEDETAATLDIPQGKVESIHIEFSDIYS